MIKNNITRFLCIIGIGVIVILASNLLLRQCGFNVSKSLSPNNEYSVSYNSFANVLLVLNKNGQKIYSIAAYEPINALWSSDSRYLILEYKIYDGWIENMILEPRADDTLSCQPLLLPGGINPSKAQLRVIEFVDDRSVLVELATELESGKQVVGWYIYDIESRSAGEIHFVE